MSKKEALQILMQSPFFYRLSAIERRELIEDLIAHAEKKDVDSVNGFIVGYD